MGIAEDHVVVAGVHEFKHATVDDGAAAAGRRAVDLDRSAIGLQGARIDERVVAGVDDQCERPFVDDDALIDERQRADPIVPPPDMTLSTLVRVASLSPL